MTEHRGGDRRPDHVAVVHRQHHGLADPRRVDREVGDLGRRRRRRSGGDLRRRGDRLPDRGRQHRRRDADQRGGDRPDAGRGLRHAGEPGGRRQRDLHGVGDGDAGGTRRQGRGAEHRGGDRRPDPIAVLDRQHHGLADARRVDREVGDLGRRGRRRSRGDLCRRGDRLQHRRRQHRRRDTDQRGGDRPDAGRGLRHAGEPGGRCQRDLHGVGNGDAGGTRRQGRGAEHRGGDGHPDPVAVVDRQHHRLADARRVDREVGDLGRRRRRRSGRDLRRRGDRLPDRRRQHRRRDTDQRGGDRPDAGHCLRHAGEPGGRCQRDLHGVGNGDAGGTRRQGRGAEHRGGDGHPDPVAVLDRQHHGLADARRVDREVGDLGRRGRRRSRGDLRRRGDRLQHRRRQHRRRDADQRGGDRPDAGCGLRHAGEPGGRCQRDLHGVGNGDAGGTRRQGRGAEHRGGDGHPDPVAVLHRQHHRLADARRVDREVGDLGRRGRRRSGRDLRRRGDRLPDRRRQHRRRDTDQRGGDRPDAGHCLRHAGEPGGRCQRDLHGVGNGDAGGTRRQGRGAEHRGGDRHPDPVAVLDRQHHRSR